MMSKGDSIEIVKSMLSWTWQCDNREGLKSLNVNYLRMKFYVICIHTERVMN